MAYTFYPKPAKCSECNEDFMQKSSNHFACSPRCSAIRHSRVKKERKNASKPQPQSCEVVEVKGPILTALDAIDADIGLLQMQVKKVRELVATQPQPKEASNG